MASKRKPPSKHQKTDILLRHLDSFPAFQEMHAEENAEAAKRARDGRSMRQRINDGDYTPKSSYVPLVGGPRPGQRDAWDRYNRETTELHDKFRRDLFESYGVSENPKRDLCFMKAWDRGHSSGLAAVADWFEDLVELIVQEN